MRTMSVERTFEVVEKVPWKRYGGNWPMCVRWRRPLWKIRKSNCISQKNTAGSLL